MLFHRKVAVVIFVSPYQVGHSSALAVAIDVLFHRKRRCSYCYPVSGRTQRLQSNDSGLTLLAFYMTAII